jgi:prevent-host-death family protein
VASKTHGLRTVNIHEAKTHLSRLVDEVANGDSFVIAKAGKPMAKVVPLDEDRENTLKRRFGFMKGMYTAPDDIKTPFAEEIEKMFYGEE